MYDYGYKQTPEFQRVSHHAPFVLPTGMMPQNRAAYREEAITKRHYFSKQSDL